MAASEVKQLLLQVDAATELFRSKMLQADRTFEGFERGTTRRLDQIDRRFAQFGRPLTGIAGHVRLANAQIGTLGNSVDRVERQIRTASSGIKASLLSATSGLAAAFSVNAVKNYADGYTRYTNQLKVAGLEGQALTKTQDALFGIAQRYGVELESLGGLYGRTSQGAKELGASQGDLLRFTNGVAAALKIQGGTAESSRSALVQLTQALGGQMVRAEEFNSINEGARPILQAVANGVDRFGGSVSKLRTEVIAGKLTSKEFFEGFLRGSAGLESQAAKANLTIAASFTVLNNALGKYIGEADNSLSATARVSQAITSIADNLDLLVPALAIIGTGFAVKFAAGPVTAMVAQTGLLVKALNSENLVLIGGKVAVAQKAEAVAAGARTEVAAIEATIAARRQDAAALAANLALIEKQRADALQARAALAVNARLGFGTLGVTRSQPDAARANQDLKAQIVTRRALARVTEELAAAETALAGAQTRAAATAVVAAEATAAATLAARAAAGATKLLTGALTLIGGSTVGGLVVLTIGALIAAYLQYRQVTQDTEASIARLAAAHRTLNEQLAAEAAVAASAAGAIRGVGAEAGAQTAKVIAFAGAVGDAAQKLYDLAKARRHEAVVGFLTTQAAENAGAAQAQARIDGRAAGRAVTGGNPVAQALFFSPEDDARDRARIVTARRNAEIAGNAAIAAAYRPLSARVRDGEADLIRNGGRDPDRQLATVNRDLTIARQSGNKPLIADLSAQKFEIAQFKKYRKDGLSAEAAQAQASKDAADFRTASGEKADRVAGARATREGAQAQRAEAAAVVDAANDTRAFKAAERQANDRIAAAHARLTGSAEERVAIETSAIENDRISRNEEIAEQGKAGRYTAERVAQLQKLNDQAAALDKEMVKQTEAVRVQNEATEDTAGGITDRTNLLQAQAQLADTAARRKDIELQLLELQQEEVRLRLQAIVNSKDANVSTEARARASRTLAALPATEAAQRAAVERQYESPGEAYRRSLTQSADQVNESIESMKVEGLKALDDQLTLTISKVFHLGGAFGSVANQIISDLIRIGVQRSIIAPLANSLFGAAGGAAGGGFFGSLFSGLGFADGGDPPLGKASLVGERGPELFVPKVPGTIIPNHALGGSGGVIRVEVDASPYFDTRVQRVAAPLAQAGAAVGAAAARSGIGQDLRRASRPGLPGGLG